MLVVEYQSNGKRVVKHHKDWHPSMISKAYIPRQKNYVEGENMLRLQRALLTTRTNPRK
jgi:hypothetical protein